MSGTNTAATCVPGESQRQRRRHLFERHEAPPARDGAEAGPETTTGEPRAARSGSSTLSALRPSGARCEFAVTLPANPAAIPIVTDGVVAIMEEQHWPKEDVAAVQLALQEALANAVRHGCRGDRSQYVRCSVICEQAGEVVMVVRDPGPGFDPGAVADPLDVAGILKPSGRGLFLIRELMDDVQFADGGREVQMRRRSSSASSR